MDLNQITLPAADLSASIAFYQTLGLRLIVRSDTGYARFELPSGATTLSLHSDDAATPSTAVLYFETDDIQGRYDALCAQGIRFDTPPRLQRWRWTEARFSDPTGHPLCLFHAGPDRRFPPWRLDPE
jgi:catechol 2,3-dioxygenase-like lactoylglutathione lyase family enzyme